MAKKQTRRSISVSRSTYERLKAFCEANNVSMSQLVETRVNDFLGGEGPAEVVRPAAPPPRPSPSIAGIAPPPPPVPRPSVPAPPPKPPAETKPAPPAPASSVPMTSAAARSVVEPPPPIIKPKQETAAPKPAEKRPDQIFTF